MNEPRDPLSSTLHMWHHEPSPTPAFNAEVWARIHSTDTASIPATATILQFRWALPLAASVAVLLSMAAGSGTAVALNHTRTTQRMAAAYVRSVDPVQMTSTHVHP